MTTTLNLNAGQQVIVHGQAATVLNAECSDDWAELTTESIVPVRWVKPTRGQAKIYTVRRGDIVVPEVISEHKVERFETADTLVAECETCDLSMESVGQDASSEVAVEGWVRDHQMSVR